MIPRYWRVTIDETSYLPVTDQCDIFDLIPASVDGFTAGQKLEIPARGKVRSPKKAVERRFSCGITRNTALESGEVEIITDIVA